MAEFMKEDFRAIYDNPHTTRRAIISRARKQAKTTQSAMILLLHLCGPEATPNSQLYSGAMSRDQASILFNLAAKMVRMSPRLSSVVDIKESAKSLICKKLGSVYKALSADASTAYGLSPKLIIHDETGQVRGPTFDLYTALETATAAQHEPLTIIISTQAPNDGDLLSLLIDDALTGADPKTVLRFNTAPPELDTFSIEAIEAANPAFHVFMNQDEIITMRNDAERMPSKQADYENLVLNRRVETKSPFISKPVWQKCGMQVMPFTPDDEVYGGLDLSSVSDLTAKVYLAPKKDDDGNIIMHVKPEFWMPEDGLKDKSRTDKVPYDVWRDQGFVRTTPGKAIDYEYVAHQIKADFDSGLNIKKIGFDRWNWKHFKPWLSKVGFRDDQLDEKNEDALFKEFGQGYQSMSPALRAIEGAVLNEKLAHGNHPLLAWCVSNAIVTQDPAGNRKLDKAKANGRIDGLVALVMAYSLAETFIEDTQPKKNPRIISIY